MSSINQCINQNGFNFSKANVEVYHNYKKKKFRKCKCSNCVKYIKNKSICIMHLCKSNFTSSSLAVATSPDDAWKEFKAYIPNYIYGHFTISLTFNSILQSMFAQLVRIKMSPCCQIVSLFFRYNFTPNPYCRYETDFLISSNIPTTLGVSNNALDPQNPYLNNCIQNNNFAKICNNTTYYNLKFFCDEDYVFTPNFSNLPIYNCNPCKNVYK
jgi:hypothetical protein